MPLNAHGTDLAAIISAAFKTILDSTHDMVFIKTADLVYIAASEPFIKMVGKSSADEIIAKTDREIFADPALADRYVADDRRLLEDGKDLIDYIEPLPDIGNYHRYGQTSKHILRDGDGNILGILGITRDITRDYVTRQHYQQELKYLFKLPEDTFAVSYIDVDDWRLIDQRRQLVDGGTLQSVNTVDELSRVAVDSIVDPICSAADFYKNFTANSLRSIYDSGRSNTSFTYQRRMTNGEIHWVRNELRFLTDADSGHLCAMLSAKNVDAKKREEEELIIAAQLDRMTMLLNRNTTMERISEIFENHNSNIHALMMIDVDNFKNLNDTFGHQAGDEFLIKLAGELRTTFRESDIIGRVGGDEFFCLLKNISDASIVLRKADELMSAIHRVCRSYTDLQISVSMGISLYPKNGTTLSELYGEADGALYQAKRNGKNQYVLA